MLRFKPFAAPKRFVFKDPDTGFHYEEATEKDLIRRIVHYRAQNELPPIEHLDLVLANYWCGLPENEGSCQPYGKLKRGIIAYIKGGIALLETIAYPREHIVTQEQADKRAEKCLGCVYNVFPDKGAFVRWSDDIAEASVGDLRAKHYESLGNCEVCSCTLKAKVWYKGSMGLDEKQKEIMREVDCWQPKEDEAEVKTEAQELVSRRKGIY